MKNIKIVFAISPHGYGHASQTSSVVNVLLRQRPGTEVWVKCPLALRFLKERFDNRVKFHPRLIDFGMAMASSLDVLPEESWRRYKALHNDWDINICQEMDDLAEINPDLVVSNIAYTTLAAARRLRIPAIAMGSLNWADIFGHYCNKYPGSRHIIEQMRDAYNSARFFIQLSPCLAMPWLENKRVISPITRLGVNKRMELNNKFKWDGNAQVILIDLGGIAMRLPIERWPVRENTYWITPDEWQATRPDCIGVTQTGLSYIDLLASVDVLITKPGYGTFSEAVCNHIPFLYVPRGDWPEEPYLAEWAQQFGHSATISRDELVRGSFYPRLSLLLEKSAQESKPLPVATGAEQAVSLILE